MSKSGFSGHPPMIARAQTLNQPLTADKIASKAKSRLLDVDFDARGLAAFAPAAYAFVA